MKPITILACLVLIAACSEKDKNDAKGLIDSASKSMTKAVDAIDLSGMTPDALARQGAALARNVAARFGDIQDKATAVDVAKHLEPLVNSLAAIKAAIGTQLDASGLVSKAKDLAGRFQNDPEVRSVIDPLIAKIKSLGG
jgi:hypothetical protein